MAVYYLLLVVLSGISGDCRILNMVYCMLAFLAKLIFILSELFQKNQLLTLKNRIRELQDKKATIESELGQDLQSQLSADEQQQIEKLQVGFIVCFIFIFLFLLNSQILQFSFFSPFTKFSNPIRNTSSSFFKIYSIFVFRASRKKRS